MAKRQRTNQVTASFHYLVKRKRGEPESEETGFTAQEFAKLGARLRDVTPIDFSDEAEIRLIKQGEKIPLLKVTDISVARIFGRFEGAYYGQEYRNTKVGTIDADSLNLRTFHYIVDYRRDGRIVVGSQYLGNYGDYDGLSYFISKTLQTNESVVRSKSFSSLRHELGSGTPVELKVALNRPGKKLGSKSLFSKTGVFVVRGSEYGDEFERDVKGLVPQVKGSMEARKAALAKIMSQGDLMDIDDEDIAGCTVLMRQDGHQYTVYLLGDNNVATRFPLSVSVPPNGLLDYDSVKNEMVRVLDNVVTPGLRR
ncbi:hypothetical protein LQ954_09490 [Sphingomonas sp. IC-11]|uniref:hypothetical protein n=1 Tax=Sphingomonas sp. IC-11 TaxID=2898528 RepID=UPI001E5C37D6|nr:hypothetical protein [Sphingomonas sp. IC-11]MCD2316381.1 hypothetical protein [Sphingomonas sp. IC-11]